MPTLNTSQDRLVFDEEFNSLSLVSPSNPNGVWNATYADGSHTLPSNGEQEYYVDPATQPSLGVNPFSVNNGVLTITANPTPHGILSQVGNLPYTSGVLTTNGTFAQTYGVFEMRAELPAGQGMWPAFWLLPADHQWPPEIDVVEMLGNQINTDYTTVHSNYLSGGQSGQGNPVANTTTGYHTYAVDWEPNTITFYFDGQQVYQVATPADLKNQPMYVLANLAVGGYWPGDPNSGTHFPAGMNIDWIRAYSTSSTVADYNTAPAPYGTADTTPGADAGSGGSTAGSTSIATFIAQQNASIRGANGIAVEVAGMAPAGGNSVIGFQNATFTSGANAMVLDGPRSQYAVSVGADGTVTVTDNSSHQTVNDNGLAYIVFDGAATTVANGQAGYAGMYFIETGANAQIACFYQGLLGRQPDLPGLEYWQRQVGSGALNLTQVATAFLGSSEFQSRFPTADAPADHGGPHDSAFVTQLYQGILNRAPDAGGAAYWLGQLAEGGLSRSQLLLDFTGSAENMHNVSAANGGWLLDPAAGAQPAAQETGLVGLPSSHSPAAHLA